MYAPDGSGGKKARCPSCKAVVTIPAATAAEDDGTIKLVDLPEDKAPKREAAGYETRAEGLRVQTCAICGSEYPLGQTCPRCRLRRQAPSRWAGSGARKYLTILAILLVFGALMAGAGYVIMNMAESGHQYTRNLMDARDYASDAACEMNLSSIYKSLKIAATSNGGRFPASLEELGYAGDQLRCPAKNGQQFLYIPGQTELSPAGNVLVYEISPTHEGKCNVLRIDGKINALTPEQVNIAISATRRNLAKAKG
jgi:hypothetical protein